MPFHTEKNCKNFYGRKISCFFLFVVILSYVKRFVPFVAYCNKFDHFVFFLPWYLLGYMIQTP